MPPIPAILLRYGPALLALAAALAAAALCRGKARQPWLRPAAALACLLGWAALEPLARLRVAALSPGVGPAVLIVPAAALVAIEALRAVRAGRNDRMLSILAAGVVGWWLARAAAGPGEGWRVAIVVAGLVGLVAFLVRAEAARALAVALALWGGAALAGFPPGWTVAAAVLAVVAAAPLAFRLPAIVPSALLAAALAATDLARGRLAQGRVGPADLVCLAALAAAPLTIPVAKRLGKGQAALAPVIAAAIAVAVSWGLHRTLP